MTDPRPVHPDIPEPAPQGPGLRSGLADGLWHRLHPATPLLRGGIGLIAVLGIVVGNFRERLLDLLTGSPGYRGDPVDYVIDHGLLPVALLIVLGVVMLFVAGFTLSWRFHTFRIGEDAVEVRSGVLFRTNRKARLDRIQGIAISRPLLARVFGAARLEISQAGQDADVQLSYLSSTAADALRLDVLRLASGARGAGEGGAQDESGVVQRRVREFLAPELDPAIAAGASVVRLHPLRLAGSVLTGESALVFLLFIAGFILISVLTREPLALIGFVPTLIGFGGVIVSRFTRSLRYTVAGTPDGIRVGYGLLSTSNDTLPPGRIHSVAVRQAPLWRPFGWWSVRVNLASRTRNNSQQQQRSLLLPVGSIDDVLHVLELALPGLGSTDALRHGIAGSGPDGFTVSPPRARVLRPLSRRRNGVAAVDDAVLLRRGALWRELVLVPQPRVQSVGMTQGPLLRALRLAALHVHTVSGPIVPRVGALAAADVERLFGEVSQAALSAARGDTSHRWRSGEAAAPHSG